MVYRLLKMLTTGAIALALGSPLIAMAQESPSPTRALSSLSLEDLTHVDVSSVSRKPQELFKTPAAVFVITREDIKAAGIYSLPELFRIVPGMQVAQIDANNWAVTARGFNGRYADKMLVLIDGRSIYSEIFSGVFWDENNVSLGDIERIEVIRGPGGTLWGANAVNGVISIITSSAKQSLGTRVVGSTGNVDNGGSIRHGAEIGQKFAYRGFAKASRHSALLSDDGTPSDDSGYCIVVGARADLQATEDDLVTFHASFNTISENQRVVNFNPTAGVDFTPDHVNTLAGYGLVRWAHRFSGSDLALQAYYSDDYRYELGGSGREKTIDFDFQHHLRSFYRNDVVWGLGYRLTTVDNSNTPVSFIINHHLNALYSLFFQDDYALIRDKLVVTGGFKLQHNSYKGLEVQPTGRALWTPDGRHSIWAAVSRAVRTPSFQDRDLDRTESIPPENGLPTEVLALGNPNFQSEVVMAYESGYRQTVGRKASIDIAGFVNSYSKLRDQDYLTPYVIPAPVPTLVIPIIYANNGAATSHGVEVAASWNPVHSLHLQVADTWMNAHLSQSGGAAYTGGDPWASPTNTANLRSNWNLGRHWTLNSSLYSISRLERVSPTGLQPVKAFVRLDQHVSFNFFESLTLSAGVNNILQNHHPEFDPADGYTVRSQIPRSAFLKAVWSF